MTGRTDRGNATDKNGSTDINKISSEDKVTQPARKLAKEDRSSAEVSKRAVPTVAEREMSLDFDMMVSHLFERDRFGIINLAIDVIANI